MSPSGRRSVSPSRRTPVFRTVLIAVLSLALATAIVVTAGLDRVAGVFADIGWAGILHILVLYTFGQLLRAARFAFSTPLPRPALPRMFAVVCMHQFLNHILPARLGELSFPLLSSRYAGLQAAAATRLLVVVRIYELGVLGVFFLVAASSIAAGSGGPSWFSDALWSVGLLLLLLIVLFLALPGLVGAFTRLIDRFPVPAWQRSGMRGRFLGHAAELHREFLRPKSIRETAPVAIFSVLIWLVLFRINFLALHYAGIDVTFSGTIFGSSFANVSHILPINTFGSVGSLEAGWTFGFALLGVPARSALASGFALHLIGIAFLGVTATASWIALRRSAHTYQNEEAPG